MTNMIDYGLSSLLETPWQIKNLILPIKDEKLFVVVLSTNEKLRDELELIYKKPIKFVICQKKQLQKEFLNFDIKLKLYEIKEEFIKQNKDSDTLLINSFIDILIRFTIEQNSSDIHIESQKSFLTIRYRVDGILRTIINITSNIQKPISSVLKLISKLDISIVRLPQDGAFEKRIDGINYSFRTSVVPTIYGESIVLRILNNQNLYKDIDTIGLNCVETIKDIVDKKQGFVLITGATGSGKTTTLYAIIKYLNQKNNQNKKIITIEDPVEYRIDGVTQINIDNSIDLSFDKILENILRQDPDIIMIGEIRDRYSLQLAIEASLTGHMVLSTIHTNSALETIDRLLNFKVKPYLIVSSLKLIVSQQLKLKLCESCKIYKDGLYIKVGCPSCAYSGYKGRAVVDEVLKIDDKLQKYIMKRYSKNKIIKKLKNSFVSIQERIKQKIKEGVFDK